MTYEKFLKMKQNQRLETVCSLLPWRVRIMAFAAMPMDQQHSVLAASGGGTISDGAKVLLAKAE